MRRTLRGQEKEQAPYPDLASDGRPRREVLTTLIHELRHCLAGTRRELLRARDLLGAPDPAATRDGAPSAVQRALAENDTAYAIMMKLRWSLLRRSAPVADPGGKGMRMNEPQSMVYVVDDSASVRRALSRLLQSVGLQVEVFGSARQFLEHELPDLPSCVVLDVRMPRMSGLDLQKEMATLGIEIPIVFITGHGDINMAVKAMKEGAVDFLPKPFNDQDLIDSINRALDGHQARRDEQAEIAGVQSRADRLTPRERQVMAMVVTGMLNKQIAGELGTSEKTIKVHRARVMEKMEAESLAELVRLAARIGIDGPADPPESTD